MKHGLVELRPNPADARSKQVWLTDAGRQFREDAISTLAPELEVLGRDLDVDLASVVPALTALRVYLDENRPDG